MNTSSLDGIRRLLSRPRRIAITTHRNPDGDAMGSSIGLALFLQALGHEVMVITPTDYPDNLKWLPGDDLVAVGPLNEVGAQAWFNASDIIFCLDFNDLSRVEPFNKVVAEARGLRVMIDHHLEPKPFYEFQWWDPKAAATAELVFRLIESLRETKRINADIATCLYTGIMTDSGSFRFPSVSSALHILAARLIDAGAVPHRIHEALYNNDPERRLRVLGLALGQRMTVLPELHTAYFALDKKDVESLEITQGDTEGLVNYGLSMAGIALSVTMIWRDGEIKMSFRSRGNFAANKLAEEFNGGGHFNAAGGRSNDTLARTEKQLIKVLKAHREALAHALSPHHEPATH